MTARVIPLRSAEVIDRRDPKFWQRRMPTVVINLGLQLEKFVFEWSDDEKLRIYERICGGDDDGGTAA